MKTTNACKTFVLIIAALGAATATAGGVPLSPGEDPLRIRVVEVAGTVDVTMHNMPHAVTENATVTPPSRVLTGHDGRLGLAQGATAISIGPDSDVEIPATAASGQLIARLVQHRGNVFYDVAPRGIEKLRVESPLLVAVVKGTQFNVAVQEDRTTISLFEGLLEIRMPDSDAVTELRAGEIAIRSRDDTAVRVLRMDQDEPVAERRAGAAAATAEPEGSLLSRDAVAVGSRVVEAELATASTLASGDIESDALVLELRSNDLNASLMGTAELEIGEPIEAGAALDLGDGAVTADVDLSVDLGDASADLGLDAALDLGSGTVAAELDLGADLGDASADLGLDAALDLGGGTVTTELDLGVDLGDTSADLGLDASLDLGGGVDLDLAGTLELADTALDLEAGVDLGDGLDAGLDVGLGGIDASIDVGSDGLELDLNLGAGGLLGGLL